MQNGVGNSVIARCKDLILVPEPEVQNQKEQLENEERQKAEGNLLSPGEKAVIFCNSLLPQANLCTD